MADHHLIQHSQQPNSDDHPTINPILWMVVGAVIGVMTFLLAWQIHPFAGLGFVTGVLALFAIAFTLNEPLLTRWQNHLVGLLKFIIQQRKAFSMLLALIGAITLLMSALFYGMGMQNRLQEAGLTLLAGSIALGIATVLHNRPIFRDSTQHTVNIATPTRHRTRWIPLVGGSIMLAMLAEISGRVFEPDFLRHTSHHVQFGLWVGGWLLVGWGLAGYVPRRAQSSGTTRPSLSARIRATDGREVIAVVLILGIALFVRTWELGYAMRLFIDEIHFANPITHFTWAQDINLLRPFSTVAAFPYLFPYMQAHFVEVFGRNLVGLRALSVFLGVVNVYVLYRLAKEMFDTPIALLAATFLAVFPPHIQYSRLGLNNIADPIFGMLAMLFILRGIKPNYRMRPNFAWAGVMLGLNQYFYEGGRLLYPALIFSWLALIGVTMYLWLTGRLVVGRVLGNQARIRRVRAQISRIDFDTLSGGIIVLVVSALIVGAPVYYALIGLERGVVVRLETAGISERTTQHFDTPRDVLSHVVNRVEEAYLIHVAIPESALYYAGTNGFLLWFVIPFFFAGMFTLIFRTSHRASLLILMWILATWFGNALMQESRISARYVVAFPALALAVALGITLFTRLLISKRTRWQNHLMLACITLLVIGQGVYYFNDHLPTFNKQFRGGIFRVLDSNDVLFRAATLPSGTRVHLIGDPIIPDHDADQLLFYLRPGVQITTMPPAGLTDAYLQMMPVNFDHAFFVDMQDEETLNRLFAIFPEMQGPFYSDYPRLTQDEQFAMFWQSAQLNLDNIEPVSTAVE